jgi:hypothetical protein
MRGVLIGLRYRTEMVRLHLSAAVVAAFAHGLA